MALPDATLSRDLEALVSKHDGFDVPCMREHIDDSRSLQPVPVLGDERFQISRQRFRMAGDVDDSGRVDALDMTNDLRRTAPGRIQQQAGPVIGQPALFAINTTQIRTAKRRCRYPVAHGIRSGASDKAFIPLDTCNLTAKSCQRQREIADAAEEIEDAVVLVRLQQLQRRGDHAPVHQPVDLNEVSGFEFDGDIKFRQTVTERRK